MRSTGAGPSGHLALLAVVGLVAATPAWAGDSRRFFEEPSRLSAAEADSLAVTSRGRLFPAPRVQPLARPSEQGSEAHVWAVAADSAGNVFLGTGPGGRILRVSSSGESTVFFTTKEPLVTALTVLPGGTLLAGTAPEGKIYRIRGDGRGEVWAETGARYVWSLTTDAAGNIFAGTGDGGVIFSITGNGEARSFFDSDDQHIVSLLAKPGGGLLAGGAGRGLVYDIDVEGRAIVLHDDELPEARALARRRDGSVVAALVAPAEPERRPPAVRIQLPDGTPGARADLEDLDDGRGPTIEGYIEGLRLPEAERPRERRGRLIEIGSDGTVTELWASSSEAIYSLALDPLDRPVFGTGEPGRLYRVEQADEVALLASTAEAQVSALLRLGTTLVLATSNPAAAYRLDRAAATTGTLTSLPFDAGAVSRWGRIGWALDEELRAELFTRTGNSATPDLSWSAWSPALSVASGNSIPNPEGRFLQWRLRLSGAAPPGAGLSRLHFTYAPLNRPPEIKDFRLGSERAAVSGEALLRWNVADPDRDPVQVRVRFRRPGDAAWSAALAVPPDFDAEPSANWRAGEGRWDVRELDEGPYELRAWADDRGGNHPGEHLETAAEATLHLWVDRSPPVIEVRTAGARLRVSVRDAQTPVRGLELLSEDGRRFRIRPDDGVCDSREEDFELDLGRLDSSFRPRVLRARDEAGNATEQPVPGS